MGMMRRSGRALIALIIPSCLALFHPTSFCSSLRQNFRSLWTWRLTTLRECRRRLGSLWIWGFTTLGECREGLVRSPRHLGRPSRVGLSALLLIGCSGGVVIRADQLPPAPPSKGFLRLMVSPVDAMIYLNEQPIGTPQRFQRQTALVKIGKYRVKVARRGYATWYSELRVQSAAPTTLTVMLLPIPTLSEFSDSRERNQQ